MWKGPEKTWRVRGVQLSPAFQPPYPGTRYGNKAAPVTSGISRRAGEQPSGALLEILAHKTVR